MKSVRFALAALTALAYSSAVFAQQLPSPAFNNLTVNGNLNLPSKSANNFFAAPDGSSGAPTFRPLVVGDMPADMSAIGITSLSQAKTAAQWITYVGGNGIIPGCVGNGIADDTTCLTAAMTARPFGTLQLGNGIYRITSGITIPAGLTVLGNGGGGGQYDFTCDVGIRVAAAGINAITMSAGSKLLNTCIDYATTPTSNAAVFAGASANSVVISDVQINKAFIGIDITGSGGTQNVDGVIRHNVITPRNVSGAMGIRVGNASTGASTVDTQILGNTVYCYDGGLSDAIGMKFLDSGGSLVTANAVYGCGVGTQIYPGANQAAIWNYFTGTVVGDTSKTNDLYINTFAASAQVRGNQFAGSWTSSAAAEAVYIDNSASGVVYGNHFVGHRAYISTNQTGFRVRGGAKFSLDSSTVCAGATSTGTAVLIEASASDSAVRGNSIGVCDNVGGGTLTNGISITQSSSNLVGVVANNSIIGTTNAFVYTPTGGNATSAIIHDNLGVDNAGGAVTGGTTITLPVTKFVVVNGPATVTTINGGWSSREVTLSNNGTITYNTGGNICNALSGASGTLTTAIYDGSSACWRLK